jgi:hypothetical protein
MADLVDFIGCSFVFKLKAIMTNHVLVLAKFSKRSSYSYLGANSILKCLFCLFWVICVCFLLLLKKENDA